MTHVLASHAQAKDDLVDLALVESFEPSEQAKEVLRQSPMDICRAFLEEERAAALAAQEKAAQEAAAEPEPLPPSSAALLEETALPPPVIVPLPEPPAPAFALAPEPQPVPVPVPVVTAAAPRGWGGLVRMQKALSIPAPPADDTDYGGWVTYLKGEDAPEDGPMALYETAALPRTETIVTGLERAVGIVPPPAPLFDTLVALPDPTRMSAPRPARSGRARPVRRS